MANDEAGARCIRCKTWLPEWASWRDVHTAIFPTRNRKASHRRKSMLGYRLCVPCRVQAGCLIFLVGNHEITWDELARDVAKKRLGPSESIACGCCGNPAVGRGQGKVYGYVAEGSWVEGSIKPGKTIAFFCEVCCDKNWALQVPKPL